LGDEENVGLLEALKTAKWCLKMLGNNRIISAWLM